MISAEAAHTELQRRARLASLDAVPIVPATAAWARPRLTPARRTVQRELLAAVVATMPTYYCLGYGTLLGAARHGGPIPWDDDLDLLCRVADYQRVRSAFRADRRFEWFEEVRPNGRFFSKIAFARHRANLRTRRPWPWPFVDVFWLVDRGHYTAEPVFENLFRTRDLARTRAARFDGLAVRIPADSNAILDQLYPGHDRFALAPSWDHVRELPLRARGKIPLAELATVYPELKTGRHRRRAAPNRPGAPRRSP